MYEISGKAERNELSRVWLRLENKIKWGPIATLALMKAHHSVSSPEVNKTFLQCWVASWYNSITQATLVILSVPTTLVFARDTSIPLH